MTSNSDPSCNLSCRFRCLYLRHVSAEYPKTQSKENPLSTFPFLPHLNTLDGHTPFCPLTPSRQPRVGSTPEIPGRICGTVNPWLAVDSIPENVLAYTALLNHRLHNAHLPKPTVPRPNSNIQNQIKLLIKRRIQRRRILPRILQKRPILHLHGEIPPLPQILTAGRLEAHEQHLHQPAVEVRVDVVLRPLHPERVVLLRVVGAAEGFAVGGPPVGVCEGGGAPVEGAGHHVAAAGDPADAVVEAVAAAFGDVDLAAAGPGAVGGGLGVHPVMLLVDGFVAFSKGGADDSPDSGPEPVAFRKLGNDFYSAVFDGLFAYCGYAC